MKNHVIWSISSVLIVCALCSSILYGCSAANQQYYNLANNCIKNGGSWVPNANVGTYSGICIGGRDK